MISKYGLRVRHEIIVVDNGSNDGSAAMMQTEFSTIACLALKKNTGYARGINIGLKQARGKYILLLNTDIVVMEGAIDAFYKECGRHPEAALFGPCLKNPDGTSQDSTYRFHRWLTPLYQRTWLQKTKSGQKELARFLRRDINKNTSQPVEWLMSSCLMVTRQGLAKLGGFDERFFVYLSDTDLCRRAWLNGFKVLYLPRISFIHYHRRQSVEELKITLIHTFDFIKYQWKWHKQKFPEIT